MEAALFELLSEGSPDDEVAVILRLVDPMRVPDGVRIVSLFGHIATCRLPREKIPEVRAQPQVASMKAARRYYAADDVVDVEAYDAPDSEAQPDLETRSSDQRRPDGELPTGADVVVAHIDFGIDFAHPDFRHPDGRTRLLALWDQSGPMDPLRPNRYGYGCIHVASDIDRALAAADPYTALGYHPARSDSGRGSHGTQTMSISCGGGRAGGPIGLAPDAAMVFVELSTATPQGPAVLSTATEEGATSLGDSVALLEGMDFIADLAGNLPLVIGASIGRQAGEHDGLTCTEQAMDAFLLAAPGRAICQSTGNYFDRDAHAAGILRPGQERTLRLNIPAGARLQTEVDLWYPGVDRFRIVLRGPEGVREETAAPGRHVKVLAGEREVGRFYHRICDPNNADNEVTLFLDPFAPAGEWELTLLGEAVADGRFHAWIERTSAKSAHRSRFHPDDVDPTTTLGTICNGFRTLAVGAYDSHQKDRPLARFSSCGPCRDGRLKPDCAAPGVDVLCARSHPLAADADAPMLTRVSGTSFACPHLTGTVALMFAAAGRPLTIDETRRLVLAHTDPIPADADQIDRLRLGAGYLNVAAAVEAAQRVGQPAPIPGLTKKEALVEAVLPVEEPSAPDPAAEVINAGEAGEARDESFIEADADRADANQIEVDELEVAGAIPDFRVHRESSPETDPEPGPALSKLQTVEAVSPAERAVDEMAPSNAAVEGSSEGEMSTAGDKSSIDVEANRWEETEDDLRVTGESDPETELADAESGAHSRFFSASSSARPAPQQGPELPFQFQVPITGGPPALALPIGGAASPFALTLPLGATAPAASPATPTPADAHAAPSPTELPPVAGADFPLYVAPSTDAIQEAMETPGVGQEIELQAWKAATFSPERTPGETEAPESDEGETELEDQATGGGGSERFGERVLAAAEALGQAGEASPHSSAAVLRSLSESLGAPANEAEAEWIAPRTLFGLDGPTPSATALFNTLLASDRPMRWRAGPRPGSGVELLILALPNQPLRDKGPAPGDLLLRVARGEGWGHVAIVASRGLHRREDLAAVRLRGEGYPLLLLGSYVHVVEPHPRPRAAGDRFARRLTNAAGLVLPDTMLVRIVGEGDETSEDDAGSDKSSSTSFNEPGAGAPATLRKGASGDAVRRAQQALNRIHADIVAIGLPGLPGCPLPEDGRFDGRTEGAIIALQQQVFDDPSKWDGAIGKETWAQFHLLAPPATPHATTRKAPPGRTGGQRGRDRQVQEGQVQEGSEGESSTFFTGSASVRPILRQGSRGTAVVELQQKLNLVHSQLTALGLAGIAGCPLAENGDFSANTHEAALSFQRQVFRDQPREWNGVVGPQTWAALDHPFTPANIAFTAAPPARNPTSLSPSTPPAAPSGAVDEGREVIATVPLLQSQRGTAPDLILRWNRMIAIPMAVDVVVHLHGFSVHGAAMRLDVDKEPASGLDFTDPDAPGESGRAEPTLFILPRGNFYGGRTGMGYDFPALVTADGLRQLVDFALTCFATRIGAPRVGMRRLLLTAHSGGGVALMRILDNNDPDEVQIFDALHTNSTPLVQWATGRLARPDSAFSSLRVLYIPGTATEPRSRTVQQALLALAPAGDPRAARYRVEETQVAHSDIPRRFGWLLLRDAGSDLPLAGGPQATIAQRSATEDHSLREIEDETLGKAPAEAFDPWWDEDNPPTVTPGSDPDEIIVTRADGTRYHVRRKIRAQVLTRPGRPRAGFCGDDERVFFRVSWCEGTQGSIDAGANVPGALKDLLKTVIGQINQGASPDQIKQTFENASVQPFVALDITKVKSWKITGDLKLDINRTGILSSTAKVSADRGWIKFGAEYKDDGAGKQVLVTVDIPLGERKIGGKKCPVRELAIWWDADCLREVPTTYTITPPGTIEKSETLYLYFEYAKDILRRDPRATTESANVVNEILQSNPQLGTALLNKRALERLEYLVDQGYWLESVDGYTSPEGRRGPPGPGDRGPAATWEGNKALSAERAEKVRKLIENRYGRASILAMRGRMRFPLGKSMPSGVGRSENPMLDKSIGVELEGGELDRILIRGDKKSDPFLKQHPEELARMTEDDRKYVSDPRTSDRKRAERLFENLRRVEIHLRHTEKLRSVDVPGVGLVHEHDCPADVIEAAEHRWGSRIPFTRPDPPLCG
jgi:peptidoglycan hydrolase-like protein with peptidoglycan-binding domain